MNQGKANRRTPPPASPSPTQSTPIHSQHKTTSNLFLFSNPTECKLDAKLPLPFSKSSQARHQGSREDKQGIKAAGRKSTAARQQGDPRASSVSSPSLLASHPQQGKRGEHQQGADAAILFPTPNPSRRALHRRPHLLDAKFQVPVFMVMGEDYYTFKFPGFETAVRSGMMESFAPDPKIAYVPEGSHFMPEQLPEQVKDHPVAAA